MNTVLKFYSNVLQACLLDDTVSYLLSILSTPVVFVLLVLHIHVLGVGWSLLAPLAFIAVIPTLAFILAMCNSPVEFGCILTIYLGLLQAMLPITLFVQHHVLLGWLSIVVGLPISIGIGGLLASLDVIFCKYNKWLDSWADRKTIAQLDSKLIVLQRQKEIHELEEQMGIPHLNVTSS